MMRVITPQSTKHNGSIKKKEKPPTFNSFTKVLLHCPFLHFRQISPVTDVFGNTFRKQTLFNPIRKPNKSRTASFVALFKFVKSQNK